MRYEPDRRIASYEQVRPLVARLSDRRCQQAAPDRRAAGAVLNCQRLPGEGDRGVEVFRVLICGRKLCPDSRACKGALLRSGGTPAGPAATCSLHCLERAGDCLEVVSTRLASVCGGREVLVC